jgi:flavin-dependent dehydrogenase
MNFNLCFCRYHVGESMLASMRHFLRFIDLDSKFDQYGFKKKVGAAFKLNGKNREGYTDFLAAGGPNNYAWNVIRSEADDLLFRHAGKSGASIHDGVKVESLDFVPSEAYDPSSSIDLDIKDTGRPVSATYTRTSTGASGTIKFNYLIDASGRSGILASNYLKSRKYNQGLKNLANWGYWKGTKAYAPNTPRSDSPYFEALTGNLSSYPIQ